MIKVTSLIQKIKKQLRTDHSPRLVPDEVFEVKELPYTLSGKKMETPIKKILLGRPIDKSANKDTMRNPASLDYFIEFSKNITSSR